jgi:hypothetical protein
MSLGDVLKEAAKRDMAMGRQLQYSGAVKSRLEYSEEIKDGKFEIRLTSTEDKDAFVETSIPYDGSETSENYCRMYFLSMVFNAAIFGMKRKKENEKKKLPPNS